MQSLPSLDSHRPILSPTTDNSLNVALAAPRVVTSRKRKSSDVENEDNDAPPEVFTAKLLSAKRSISFASITLVARACLPLTWLNMSTSPSLVFQASIPSVEEWEQRALIVRKVPNGGLFAVEQVATGTYVACALHSSVVETWCHDAAIGKVAEVRVDDLLLSEGDAVQRGHARTASGSSATALPTPKSPKRQKNRRGALARMSILALPSPASTPSTMESTSSPSIPQQLPEQFLVMPEVASESFPAVLLQADTVHDLVQEPLPLTPAAQISLQNPFENTIATGTDEVTEIPPLTFAAPDAALSSIAIDINPLAAERLRTQYFEHLYTSKTSLAFYVKGPLARARAHVRSAEDAAKAIGELLEFYIDSILPTKKVDLKYKESVAKVIKELPIQQHEDGADAVVAKKKTSRKKKIKLGKDGLWTDEEEFLARWWRSREVKGTVSSVDQAEEMRKEMADLRMRETKMQMLLILEVMLLEAAASKLAESVKPPNDPNIKVETVEEDPSAILLVTTPHNPPKKVKKRDWAAEIDTIVDRLCIWHTVNLDDLLNPSENKSSKKDVNGSTASRPSDALRDLCKEVLLPFYSAKLPVQIKSICRKLGGSEISPKRPQPARPIPGLVRSSSSIFSLSKVKPGQPLTTRTLERVLSEDHQLLRHASPPTFSRASSISAPIVPTLKREPSERPISRGGMHSKSMSFSNREIDLVADQKVHDVKRRKLDRLALRKKELEAAIDALKKPDRRTVASQIMDEAEERKRLEQEKKLAVQITATPKARRIKGQSQMMDEPELPPMPRSRLVSREQDAAMVIPSSTVRPRLKPSLTSSASGPRSSALKKAVLAAIHETPSRGLLRKTSSPLDLPLMSHPSTKVSESVAVAGTPAFRRTRDDSRALSLPGLNLSSSQPPPPSSDPADTGEGLTTKRSRRPVLFTPLKKSEVRLDQVFRDAPMIPEQAGRVMDRVMGGKGRGIDDDFDPLHSDQLTMSQKLGRVEQTRVDSDAGDIYDKLGWNDDFDL